MIIGDRLRVLREQQKFSREPNAVPHGLRFGIGDRFPSEAT